MLEYVKKGDMALFAGTVSNTKETPKVTSVTISDGTDSVTIEFWEEKKNLVKNVCINTFLSVYARKSSNRIVGYAIKRQGLWNFPASLKDEPDTFKKTVKDLIADGVIEDCDYPYTIESIQNLIFQVDNVSEEISKFFDDCIIEEQNIVISTVTQVDKYNDALVKVSVPVTENNKTEYYKIAFRGKQGRSAYEHLMPENGIKKKALISCGKIRDFKGVPNAIGFTFKIL